jgi:hypothetical protein
LAKEGFGVGHQLGLACFASFAWALWITTNKMCIQKVFSSKLLDIIYLFAHETKKSQKLLLGIWANWMIRFGKRDCPILLGLTAVKGAVGLR